MSFRITNHESRITSGRDGRFGESMAILAGDLALAWADELFGLSLRGPRAQSRGTRQSHVESKQEIATPSERSRDDILKLYQKMKEEVIYGQTLDVAGGVKEQADELKTAWYSVVRPLQTGSVIAAVLSEVEGSPSRLRSNNKIVRVLKLWEQYGLPVGRLFQLRDDVLDGELTQDGFAKQAKPLEKQALEALEPLETSGEIKQLLIDFVQFVQKRKS